MSAAAGPDIVTDGLVLCLDAADKKSLLAPPTTNLANNSNGTINWYASGLGGSGVTSSTVDANNYHYRFALNKNSNSYASGRFNFDHTNLTGGETYIISYKYKITSGSGTFRITDFCDISVNSNRVTIDIGDGWYYETAYGTRSSYTETYDFFDFYASDSLTVDIKEMQVEHTSASSPLATPFVSYQRKWQDRKGDNAGTLYNMSDQANYSSDSKGYLIFDGASDYMQLDVDTTLLDGDPSLSVDMFVRRRTGTNIGSNAGFWGIGGSGRGKSIQGWTPTTNLIHLDVYDSTRLATSYYYPEGQFVHVCWTKNGTGTETTNVKCYVNGVEASLTKNRNATTTNQLNTSTSGIGVCLGRINADSSSFHAPVDVGSFKVYSRALTAAEVTQNYNATKSRFGL